jgi:hypothetical protein
MKKNRNLDSELHQLGFTKNQIWMILNWTETLPIQISEEISNTSVSIKDGVVSITPTKKEIINEPENYKIESGEVIQEIKNNLREMIGISEFSPILSDGCNESRLGKDYTFYTIKNDRKQFTVSVLDNR